MPPATVDVLSPSSPTRSPPLSLSPPVSLPSPQTDPPTNNPVINPGLINGKILKKIPQGSSAPCAKKLSSILDDIVRENSEAAWNHLFLFSRRCLIQPTRGGHRRSLAACINQAIEQERDTSTNSRVSHESTSLAKRVSAKLEDGDFRGAVRLVSLTEPVCRADKESLRLLQEKHPPSHSDSSFPPPDTQSPSPTMSSSDVIHAVFSFPTGSVGGPDGLRPQHLYDLVTYTLSEGSDRLLDSLTEFVNLVICGKVPVNTHPFFFGATLTGLGKKGGGVRPIAVGCSLHRMAAKRLCTSVFDEMGSVLFPHQLGFGTATGAEAAVHAARAYLYNLEDGHLMIKLDFRNAFNSI